MAPVACPRRGGSPPVHPDLNQLPESRLELTGATTHGARYAGSRFTVETGCYPVSQQPLVTKGVLVVGGTDVIGTGIGDGMLSRLYRAAG